MCKCKICKLHSCLYKVVYNVHMYIQGNLSTQMIMLIMFKFKRIRGNVYLNIFDFILSVPVFSKEKWFELYYN